MFVVFLSVQDKTSVFKRVLGYYNDTTKFGISGDNIRAVLPVSTKDSRVKKTQQRKMTLKFFNFKRGLSNDHDH
jgi:hypothetical protein